MPALLLLMLFLVSCQDKTPVTPKVRKDEIQKQEEREGEREIAKAKPKCGDPSKKHASPAVVQKESK